MIKIKKLILFFFKRGRFVIKMKKNAFTLTKEKFHDNQEFKTIKNKSLKFLELHIMNLKIH